MSLILISALLQGCLEINLAIKIKPDGSGTITETVLFSDALVSLAQSTAGQNAAEGLYNVEDLKAKARKYGEGVKYNSVRNIKKGQDEGYSVKYTFEDIEKVRLQYNPSNDLPKEITRMGGITPDSGKMKPMTFSFQKGSESKLVIHIPLDSASSDFSDSRNPVIESALDTAADARITEKIAEMMGIKIKVTAQFDGKITDTDAPYRNGNEITLFGLDLKKLLRNNKTAAQYNLQKYSSFYQMRDIISKVPGIEMNFQESITVLFKK